MNKNSNGVMPQARNKGLVVQKLAEEVVVYDTGSQKAHCLNSSAALIWEHCDGKRTVRELSDLLEGDQRGKEEMVWVALDQLEKSQLLQHPITRPNAIAGMNRRQMLKAAGIVAMIAVPVVSTIVAPKAAQAVTCLATGQGCTISAQCCSGLCSGGLCA
jgi:hypothetical protein